MSVTYTDHGAQDLANFTRGLEQALRERNAQLRAAVDALYSVLNVEGPALCGGELGAFEGLDVPWHFAKVREAIKACGIEPS